MTRCFIAINLPTETKKELGFIIEKLKEKNSNKNIKWVKPENIHLTLHFLGCLDENKIEQVKKIIKESITGLLPIKIELKDLNAFPNFQQPRVLFISGQETREVLADLQRAIGKKIEKIGIEIDARSWQIHLTLARLKEPLDLRTINLNELRIKSFEIKSIDLMKSELTSQGANYTLLKKFSL